MGKYLKILSGLTGLLTLMVFSTCNEKDESVPVVQTGEITILDDSLVVVTAAILNDPGDIIEYGFVWGTDPDNVAAKKIACGSIPISDVYESRISKEDIFSALVEYRVRAYVRTDARTFYGREVKFLSIAGSGPRINYFEPDSGTWGDTVSIYGYNFLYRPGSAKVSIGTINLKLETINDSLAVVVIPSNLNQIQAAFKLTNVNKATISEKKFILLPPLVERISPDSATVGTKLQITGKRFSTTKAYASVSVDGKNTTFQLSSDSLITLNIPAGITNSKPKIIIKVLGQEPNEELYINNVNPIIKTVTPFAWPGDQITITGKFFGPSTPVYTKVFVNGLQCSLNQVSDTLIKAILPLDVVTGPASVKVTTETRFTEVTGQLDINGPNPTGIEPQEAAFGDEVVIRGSRFTQFGEMSVSFDEFAATITEINDDFIRVIVPNTINRENTKIRFKSGNRTFYTSTTFKLLLPEITDVYPKQVTFLDTISISGKYFNNDIQLITVRLGAHVCKVVENNRNMIKVVVPTTYAAPQYPTEGNFVLTSNNTFTVNAGPIGLRAPEIHSISGNSLRVTDTLIITGRYFSPSATNNIIRLGSNACYIISVSHNEIAVAIPSTVVSGLHELTISSGNRISSEMYHITASNPYQHLLIKVMSTIQEGRWDMGAFITSNRLIMAGGRSYRGYYPNVFRINVPDMIQTDFYRLNLQSPASPTYSPCCFTYQDTGYYLLRGTLYKYNDGGVTGFKPISTFPGVALGDQSGFLIDDKFYVGTGLGINGYSTDEFWMYNLESGLWTRVASYPGGPMSRGVGFAIEGRGYVGFGLSSQRHIYEYNPTSDSWQVKCEIPELFMDIAFDRFGLIGIASGDKAILGLGSSQRGKDYSDMYEYIPGSNTWKRLTGLGPDLPLSFSAAATDGEYIYVAGGRGSSHLRAIKFKISDL